VLSVFYTIYRFFGRYFTALCILDSSMEDFLAWVKKNLVVIIALIVVLGVAKYYLVSNSTGLSGMTPSTARQSANEDVSLSGQTMMGKVGIGGAAPIQSSVAPVQSNNRLVIRDTTLSLLVKSVDETTKRIEDLAKTQGGYFVESNLNRPEEKETGTVAIRVPSEKREETLEDIKKMGVRVVSELVVGEDVTDQYVDTQARLDTLLATKTKLQALLSQATSVNDILNVQRELDNLQYQIDQLKGEQKYLEQSSKLTKITVYLSTDELALPYAPDQAWRPSVVFKQAVRSLVLTARDGVNLIIWLAVYAPLWLPVLIIIWWLKRRKHGKN
jgi:hypothetical protein